MRPKQIKNSRPNSLMFRSFQKSDIRVRKHLPVHPHSLTFCSSEIPSSRYTLFIFPSYVTRCIERRIKPYLGVSLYVYLTHKNIYRYHKCVIDLTDDAIVWLENDLPYVFSISAYASVTITYSVERHCSRKGKSFCNFLQQCRSYRFCAFGNS